MDWFEIEEPVSGEGQVLCLTGNGKLMVKYLPITKWDIDKYNLTHYMIVKMPKIYDNIKRQ